MSIKAKSCFEFTLQDLSKLPPKVYSPPFATSHDTFWQLKFKPTSQDYPEHCSVYLVALPNQEEVNTTSTWPNRAQYSADIYLKNPRTFLIIKKMSLDTSKFSAIKPLRGWNRFCKKSLLIYDDLILGVEFDTTEFQPNDLKPSFPGNGKPFPNDLLQAWGEQLNKLETADVEFRVQGVSIYANTSILSKRSQYFKRMFEGKWIESVAYNNHKISQKQPQLPRLKKLPITSPHELQIILQQQSSKSPSIPSLIPISTSAKHFSLHELPPIISSASTTASSSLSSSSSQQQQPQKAAEYNTITPSPSKRKRLDEFGMNDMISAVNISLDDMKLVQKTNEKIVIHVMDFHPDTFIEMLRYLYTNQVAFGREDSHRSAIDIYKIADKYLIDTLQQIAKVKLCKSVNIENAAQFLFGTAWQYEELKEHVMSYVVQNFKSVQKTRGWLEITSIPGDYPYFGDLLNEILRGVLTDGDSEYSDS
ncbi:6371_t:CDS:2 [Ambispora gerdemannii]|uniref:6371_t:CDS:1 n=1 Tax=Ambispora gerdemannii TaxID=144530 RepID=A0A9N8V498_9GLOM|nr:6371_t:CDS:2 [Ambispora gerdemannii]